MVKCSLSMHKALWGLCGGGLHSKFLSSDSPIFILVSNVSRRYNSIVLQMTQVMLFNNGFLLMCINCMEYGIS